MATLMRCGCAAQGITPDGKPICAVHLETTPAPEPDLTGRTAMCQYGGNETPSSTKLAFFEYRPNSKHDSYYCGCYGWD